MEQAEGNGFRLQVTTLPDDPQADFFRVELNLCFTFCDVARNHFLSGKQDLAQSALQKAQIGFETVERFLADPKHSRHLSSDELNEVRSDWEKLRDCIRTLREELRMK